MGSGSVVGRFGRDRMVVGMPGRHRLERGMKAGRSRVGRRDGRARLRGIGAERRAEGDVLQSRRFRRVVGHRASRRRGYRLSLGECEQASSAANSTFELVRLASDAAEHARSSLVPPSSFPVAIRPEADGQIHRQHCERVCKTDLIPLNVLVPLNHTSRCLSCAPLATVASATANVTNL